MGKYIRYLFANTTGRAILAGVIFLGSMGIARWYYVDRPRQLSAEAEGAGADLLEQLAERLDAKLGEVDDPEAFAKTLTSRSEWYPANVPCGARIPYPSPREPIWDVLEAPTEGKTEFQYRFERVEGVFLLRARRDSDCDGIYAVHTLTGRTNWTTLMRTDLEAQNIDE